jgi:hypothetical protein
VARLFVDQREQQQLQIVGRELAAAREAVAFAAESSAEAASERTAGAAAEWPAVPAAAALMAADRVSEHLEAFVKAEERGIAGKVGVAGEVTGKTMMVMAHVGISECLKMYRKIYI